MERTSSSSSSKSTKRCSGKLPKSLAILPVTEGNTFRGRYTSETDCSSDSGVVILSQPSSLESVGSISPPGSEKSSDQTRNIRQSTSPSSSSSKVAPSLDRVSSVNSDETVTEERVLRDDLLHRADIESNVRCGVTRTSSQPNRLKSVNKSIPSVILSPELPNQSASTLKNQIFSPSEFVPCKRHGLGSEFFCWSCGDDGCHMCMVERHENHKLYKSVTCENLLSREELVKRQMNVCLKTVKNITDRLAHFQGILLHAAIDWQKNLGMQVDKLAQIRVDFEHHLKGLYSISIEIKGEFTSFKRMMSGLRILYSNRSFIEMHDNANPVRRSLINLQSTSIRATEVITSAILSETGGRNTLSDVIKASGMEMLTYTPILNLEEVKPKSSVFFKSLPDTRAPDIPPVLESVFSGRGLPSPTICDSFTFARMDPISSTSAHRDSNWPSTQDQVQMAHFDAVSQLLCPKCPIRPKVNNFDCRWEPRTPQPTPSTSTTSWIPHTPQPQPSHFVDQFAEPPLQKSQSLVAMWERIEQPGPSVPPLVPLPSAKQQQPLTKQPPADNANRVFEIGYHTSRNYSQIKTPVLKLEGKYADDPARLCRPWGICCDKRNLIYVADRSNNRIAVFSIDGTLVHSFGSKGTQPGEFDRPAGLAFDFKGRLVVADKDNHRIQVFTRDGEYLFHFGHYGNHTGDFFYPWDVACSSDGQIAVTDTRNHRVQIFTYSGVFIRKYGWESRPSMLRELDSPRGVVFVKNNVLLVTDFNNHRIIQITFGDRVFMSQFNKTNHPKSTLNRPQGLTLDAEGNVLVCDSRNDRIVVFSPAGEFIGEFGKHGKEDGQFDRTVDISVAPDGKVAVVDLHHNRVQIF